MGGVNKTKASVKCKCKKCGNEFVVGKACHNRAEADRWEEWADGMYTMCTDCYNAERLEKEKVEGIYFDVYANANTKNLKKGDHIAIVFKGGTYPRKDDIKAIGAKWGATYNDDAEFFYLPLPPSWYPQNWVLRCSIDEMEEKMQLAESIGARRNNVPTDEDIAVLSKFVDERMEIESKKEQELKDLGEMPKWDDDVQELWKDGDKWNWKFYGKENNYRIYLSSREVHITSEQKKSMEQSINKWEIGKKKIEEKYRPKEEWEIGRDKLREKFGVKQI